MKKLRFIQYLTCFTIILVLISALPGGALATKVSSDGHGNQNQYMREDSRSSYDNEIEIRVMSTTLSPIRGGFRITST